MSRRAAKRNRVVMASATDSMPPSGGSFGASTGLYPDPQEGNQRGWRPVLNKDATEFLKQHRHATMISDGRYIYSGSGMVSGAIRKRADYVVGAAWAPLYIGSDDRFRESTKPLVSRWANLCDVRGGVYDWRMGLRLASMCIDRDGDVFAIKRVTPEGSPRIQWLEAHRIGSPTLGYSGIQTVPKTPETVGYEGRFVSAGVIMDDDMRPIGYNVLPPSAERYTSYTWNIYPASDVVHFFDPEWHSQARGIPSVIRAVLDWYDLGETREAEKVGIKARSSIAYIEKNESGRAPASALGGGSRNVSTEPQSQTIARGLIRYIKASGEITSLDNNKPGEAWQNFMEYITRGAFAGMDLPYEFAWDASKLNGTSVRSMVGQVQRSVDNRIAVMHKPAMQLLQWAVAVYMNRGYITFTDDWWNWDFSTPPKFSVDIGRDSQNRREDFNVGIRTLSDIVGEDGGDVESHCRARASDYLTAQRIAAETGVPLTAIVNPGGNPVDPAQAIAQAIQIETEEET